MSVEADFLALTGQVHQLLGSGTVHLLLGCPDQQLRHPLLELCSTDKYHYAAGSADIKVLLHEEQVRALCDMAILTGQVQSSVQTQTVIVAAPLERTAGVLGVFVVTDSPTEAFSPGEHLLLSGYLARASQSVERSLLHLYSSLLRQYFAVANNAAAMALEPTDATDSVIITHATDTQEQRDEFISIISHELRIPLTSIKGYAVLLQAYGMADNSIEEMTPARQRHFLSTIVEQADHLEALIGDLLDMSRIQLGRLALHFTQVDVAHLCQHVIELAQQKVDQERYTIRCLLDQQLPFAWADPVRLQQVLTNLLENAIKYSPEGGTIELLASYTTHFAYNDPFGRTTGQESPGGTRNPPETLDLTTTELSSSPGSPMLQITICDQGIGISQQQQSLLFQPFSRLEHPATEQVPGAGLGLYISRRLVEAMHGHLTLRSSEGEGTCVMLTLPAIPVSYHAASA